MSKRDWLVIKPTHEIERLAMTIAITEAVLGAFKAIEDKHKAHYLRHARYT